MVSIWTEIIKITCWFQYGGSGQFGDWDNET